MESKRKTPDPFNLDNRDFGAKLSKLETLQVVNTIELMGCPNRSVAVKMALRLLVRSHNPAILKSKSA